ncbi:hypothetical protein LXL04_039898 [Taraxacum kok-saghyz]
MGKGKTCHLYLTKDHAIFLHYRISSQNDDRIAFTIDLSLRSIVTIYTEFGGSHSCPTLNRLQIKQPMPFLTFETSRYPDLTFSNSKPLAQDLPQTLVQNQECGLLHQVPKPVKLGLKIQVSEPISSEQSKFGVVSICLRRRPGVQIKIFIPLTKIFLFIILITTNQKTNTKSMVLANRFQYTKNLVTAGTSCTLRTESRYFHRYGRWGTWPAAEGGIMDWNLIPVSQILSISRAIQSLEPPMCGFVYATAWILHVYLSLHRTGSPSPSHFQFWGFMITPEPTLNELSCHFRVETLDPNPTRLTFVSSRVNPLTVILGCYVLDYGAIVGHTVRDPAM